MRTFSLLLQGGRIEDAFAYRSSLYCWTFDNRLQVYSISDIEEAARFADPQRADSIMYGLFHSGGILASNRNYRNKYDLFYAPDDVYESPLTVDIERIRHRETQVRLDGDALLDLLIFYDRMYFGTDAGLFSIDVFDSTDPPQELKAKHRLRTPCYAMTGGLGSVAASLGSNGLRVFFDEARLSLDSSQSKKVAPISIGADIGYRTVVNYRSRSEFDFYAGEIEKTANSLLLTGVRKAKTTRRHGGPVAVPSEPRPAIDFAMWEHGRMVTFGDGSVESISVVIADSSRTINRHRQFSSYRNDTRVVTATRAGHFFAIETDDSVILMSDYGQQEWDTGPVVSMRTYPKSKRFLRLTTATTAKGLWMMGAYAGNE